MSVEKHLANAKKFFGQGRYADAIYEYRCVLNLDPNNADALAAMRSLTDMPAAEEAAGQSGAAEGGKIKTNFLSHQADEASGTSKGSPFMVIGIIVAVAALYGLYQLVTYYMNADKITAIKYTYLHLLKPTQKGEAVYVNALLENLNPQDITDVKFKYEIKGSDGAVLSSGEATVPGMVPAGDQRTFSDIQLGSIKGKPSHLSNDVVDLKLGPKPSMTPQLANKFIESSAMKPEEALVQFTEFVKGQPEFAPGYIRLGQCLLANKDSEKAIKAFQKAIKLDSENSNAHYHLGVALFYKSDREGARKEFEEALKLQPGDQVVAEALKQIETKDGSPEKKDEERADKSEGKGEQKGSGDKDGK